MGFSRFDGVQRLQGSSMPFENYLKQINLLYPNLPDMYFKYFNMIHEFYFNQYMKLKRYNVHQEYRENLINVGMNEIVELREDAPIDYADYLLMFNTLIFNELSDPAIPFEKFKELFDSNVIGTLNGVSGLLETFPMMYMSYFTLMHNFYFEEYERLRELDMHKDYREQIISTGLFEILDFKNTDTDLYTKYMHDFVSYVVGELSDIESTLNYGQKMGLFYHTVRDSLSAVNVLYGQQDHIYLFHNIVNSLKEMIQLYSNDSDDDNVLGLVEGVYWPLINSVLSVDDLSLLPIEEQTLSRKIFNILANQVFSFLLTDIAKSENNYFKSTCSIIYNMSNGTRDDYWMLTIGDSPHESADKMARVVNGIFADLSGVQYATMVAPIIDVLCNWMGWLYNVHPGLFQTLENAMKNAKG